MTEEISSEAQQSAMDQVGPKVGKERRAHPSWNLVPRGRGYGIGGGYERPYKRERANPSERVAQYGPLPHSGYYGAGEAARPFKGGQASFRDELEWYRKQYGEKTTAYGEKKS